MDQVDITVTLKLRPATKHDFVDSRNQYKNGTMYFLRSEITGQFDKQPYYISPDTNKVELRHYFNRNQVFVCIRHFDDTEVFITAKYKVSTLCTND